VFHPEVPEGIEDNVKIEKLKNENIYNLSGQRISVNSVFSASSALPKGVYIVDGKKVMVR
jgi:hypothetical protein